MSGLFDQITNYSPPLLTAGQVNYKGTWSAAANTPTLTSPPAATSKGDYYVVSAAGTQFGITFAVGDWIISNGTAWEKVDLTDSVSSVFGRTGAVVSANGDYTASQVTNVPAGTISSTNVQDAINELSADIATAQNVLDAYVTNADSVTITKGQVVYAFGATGNRMSVKLANNSADATSAKTVGVVLDSSIAAGNPGYIRMVGVVDGLNLGAYNDGDTLYLGATAGSVTSTKPYAPNHLVYVGIVERANNGNGQLYVRVQNGYELDEIHDVQITSAPDSGALLVRDATNSLWKAARLTAGTNIAITNADASVTVGITGIIAGTNGGTGVNNGANTITIAGNVTHAGAFTQTFTATANTSLTLPTTGTLATLAGSEALSNKTITASAFNGTVGATTPSTGAFTTLTASDYIRAASGSSKGVRLYNSAGDNWAALYVAGGAGTGVMTLASAYGPVLTLDDFGKGNFAAGLAVTGTLSATGNTTIGSSGSTPGGFGQWVSVRGGSNGAIIVGRTAASNDALEVGWTTASASLTTYTNVPININVNNATVGAFTSTGLAVTGALSATGNVLGSGTYVGISNPTYQLTSSNGIGAAFRSLAGADIYGVDFRRWTGTATEHSVAYIGQYPNAVGGYSIGIYYDASKATNTQATTRIVSIDQSGLAVTGALSSTTGANFATSSGNVGIGTSSPTYKIDVSDTSGSLARFKSTTASDQFFINNAASNPDYSANVVIQSDNAGSAGHDLFRAQVTNYSGTRFVIRSNGNVGIGTTSPAKTLDVNGSVQFRDAAGAGQAFWVPNKGVGSANSGGFGLGYNAVNYTPASASSNIYWDPNVGYFTLSTSSRKYKRNIVAVTDEQLDKALLLKPSYYQRNEYEYYEYGFIAEEVNEIGLDEFVTKVEGEISGLNYEKMVTLAIGLAQRQAKENANLVAQVAALSQRLAALENS